MIENGPDLIPLVAENATAVGTKTGTSSNSLLPNSTFVGVLASVISAVIIYSVRQYWEKTKLRNALITEIEEMEGISNCADRMDEISTPPPKRGLQPDDVPSPESIPTAVYDNNTGKIGVLSVFNSTTELENAVEFYSKVKRYKSIIAEVRQKQASDPDEEDLYDDISQLNELRLQFLEEDALVKE